MSGAYYSDTSTNTVFNENESTTAAYIDPVSHIGRVLLHKFAQGQIIIKKPALIANETITLISTDGTSVTYTAKDIDVYSNNWFDRHGINPSTHSALASSLKQVIEHGHKGKIIVTLGSTHYPDDTLVLTQAVEGEAGMTKITVSSGIGLSLEISSFGGFTDYIRKEGGIPSILEDGNRVGNVTLIGEYQDISYLKGYRQGKNVKNLFQFFEMNIPLLRVANCQFFRAQRIDGLIDHSFNQTRDIALGQSDDVFRGSGAIRDIVPFDDRLSVDFNPVTLVEVSCAKGVPYVLGYPIVTDNLVNFYNYNDPDALDGTEGGQHRDGTIEPLGIRASFANANTNFDNIQILGIRGSFAPHHQEQGDFSDGKGSSPIDDKVEIRKVHLKRDKTGKIVKNDWFEDCQDLVMNENVFGTVGIHPLTIAPITAGTNYYSKWGYVSDGNYTLAPFFDKSSHERSFEGQYRHLGASESKELLENSSRDISPIGSRFKSMQNGVRLRPKYDDVVSTVLGTDSIAFSGLLRE